MRALRTKSVGPFIVLASLGRAESAFPAAAARARPFGTAVWIVDDLWDAADDWRCGGRSRPWLIISRETRDRLTSTDHALLALAESGVLQREAACLRRALLQVTQLDEPTRRCLGTTLASWVEMAVPLPLMARLDIAIPGST
jgi:hypothetical protein